MKTIFVIHGSFGNNQEHYLPWLKKELCNMEGYDIIIPNFPVGVDIQSYESWSKELDNYKDKINNETIFVGRSIGAIFAVKYLLENNLKIKKLISVSGFNGYINVPDYDYVNKTFFLNSLDKFKSNCKDILCFYSDNDPYVPYFELDMFARCLATKKIEISGAGHFNADSGYGKKFELLLEDILRS